MGILIVLRPSEPQEVLRKTLIDNLPPTLTLSMSSADAVQLVVALVRADALVDVILEGMKPDSPATPEFKSTKTDVAKALTIVTQAIDRHENV